MLLLFLTCLKIQAQRVPPTQCPVTGMYVNNVIKDEREKRFNKIKTSIPNKAKFIDLPISEWRKLIGVINSDSNFTGLRIYFAVFSKVLPKNNPTNAFIPKMGIGQLTLIFVPTIKISNNDSDATGYYYTLNYGNPINGYPRLEKISNLINGDADALNWLNAFRSTIKSNLEDEDIDTSISETTSIFYNRPLLNQTDSLFNSGNCLALSKGMRIEFTAYSKKVTSSQDDQDYKDQLSLLFVPLDSIMNPLPLDKLFDFKKFVAYDTGLPCPPLSCTGSITQ